MKQSQNSQSRTQRRISPDAEDEIEALYAAGVRKAPEIFRRLQRDSRLALEDIPSQRTVRRIVQELDVFERSEPWTLAEAEPGEPGPIMDVLAALAEHGGGPEMGVTKAQAACIRRVFEARPDIPPWTAHRLSHTYLRRAESAEPTFDLDALLSFAPWRDRDANARYYAAVIMGRIQPAELGLLYSYPPGYIGNVVGEVAALLADEWIAREQSDEDFWNLLQEHGWDDESDGVSELQSTLASRFRGELGRVLDLDRPLGQLFLPGEFWKIGASTFRQDWVGEFLDGTFRGREGDDGKARS